jgi:pyridinium-3,5-biscarboxylic acid mononucleotide sulfurtransferase
MAANMIQNEEIERALQRLRDVIKNTAENNRLCIAYSGGLDSRFLAFFASRCGLEVELLHASAAHVSLTESQDAVDRAQAMGLTVRVVHPPLPSPEELAAAGRNRCYVCKR